MDNSPPLSDRWWSRWRGQWRLREGTVYLNHGSFGPPPEPVRMAHQHWQDQMNQQPMDFFVRTLEGAALEARRRMAQFVGTADQNLVLIDNATWGMNVVADSIGLGPEDEVILTDHEYGAVRRIWQRACRRARAAPPITADLPMPVTSTDEIVDAILARATPNTRLIVVSHITSPTAITLPIAEICHAAHERDIAVCVDGPHAVAQLPLDLDLLNCDYYTASCHKWLCAPFGSGFLYVLPKHQANIEPPMLSWGRLLPDVPEKWNDEFIWSGTRNPSALLAIPAAIDFLRSAGMTAFQSGTHELARYARQRLAVLTDAQPLVPDSPQWYGSMAHVPLPEGDSMQLQRKLWDQYGIEVPIVSWKGARYVRVSCHLYTQRAHIDRLADALEALLKEEAG